MSARIILGESTFTIREADRLLVQGGLVEIQRAVPTGFETVAVAGEDLLVMVEPAARTRTAARDGDPIRLSGLTWLPVVAPLD